MTKVVINLVKQKKTYVIFRKILDWVFNKYNASKKELKQVMKGQEMSLASWIKENPKAFI